MPLLKPLETRTSTTSLVPYADPTVRKLITKLKYASAVCLIGTISSLLDRYAFMIGLPSWVKEPRLTITSVPASRWRLLERGVDQASIIADMLHATWCPQAAREHLLRRTRHTIPNAQLEDERARKGNVLQAFETIMPVSGTVILVDDVVTSGATTDECRRTLEQAGASRVLIFTMASGK